jgi:hypothetical protein
MGLEKKITARYISTMADLNNPFDLPLLDEPQFSRDDVLRVTGLSSGQLKGMLDRDQVTLHANHKIGHGRRFLFTGGDIIKIEAARVASGLGFPLRWVSVLADKIAGRAVNLLAGVNGILGSKEFALATYPNADGSDWVFVPITETGPASPLPVGVLTIDVDRLIEETRQKLQALVDEADAMPDFSIPEVRDDLAERYIRDFFDKDEHGRIVRVGLTWEETRELNAIEESDNLKWQQRDRYSILIEKTEAARMKRVMADIEARRAASDPERDQTK